MQLDVSFNQTLKKMGQASNLTDALSTVENYCKNCKTASPMVCVERCEVWQVKHEIQEIRRVTSEKTHLRKLFNALKNKRRLKILKALCEHAQNVEELQKHLHQNGFHHSHETVVEAYLKPLISVGLVRMEGVRFKVTFYGRMVQNLLSQQAFSDLLPVHSCCYEETVLKELNTPKTFNELATHVPPKSLSRILMRLRAKKLLIGKAHSHYVSYHKAENTLRMQQLSPTEKRVLDAIPQAGITIRSLSAIVGINIRRTFKYLRRLREKNLVFALRAKRTYELTVEGREIMRVLEEIERLASSSMNVLVLMPQRVS